MQKNLRLWATTALALVGVVALNSCAYDPNYTSVGSSYDSSYGDGYGYGGRTFSTSVFVGTGDPRWGYDPYCHSYYDYRRRAYYDPYLNGYYPVGYRPRAIYGVAHPHGWHPGRGYLRPPSRVTNVTISNYHNRESAYRNSGYVPSGRNYGNPQANGNYDRQNYPSQARSRQSQKVRPPANMDRDISGQGRSTRNDGDRQPSRYPSPYYGPVSTRQQENFGRGRVNSAPQPTSNTQRQIRQIAPPDQARPPRQQMKAPQQQAAPGRNQQPQQRNARPPSRGSGTDKQNERGRNGGGSGRSGRNLEND